MLTFDGMAGKARDKHEKVLVFEGMAEQAASMVEQGMINVVF